MSYHEVKVDRAAVIAKLTALEGELVRRAVAQKIAGVEKAEQVEVTQISPDVDLGKTVEDWTYTYTAAQTWERYIQAYDIGEKVIGIIGVRFLSATPYLVAVRFGLGWPLTFVKAYFHVEDAHTEPECIALFRFPVIFDKGSLATIEVYGRAGAAGVTEKFAFIGLVARKKGTMIS